MFPKSIELCFFKDYFSAEEALIDLLSISKSQIKKILDKKKRSQSIERRRTYKFPIDLINHLKINPIYKSENEPKVLFENDQILAISKPNKIHSHPLTYLEHDNLCSWLVSQKYWSILNVNQENWDRGLLFRLDFETSGVVFFSKKNELYQKVRENFSKLCKTKIYLAIVEGKILEKKNLTHYLGPKGPKGQWMREDSNGQLASLSLEPISYLEDKDLSLIKVSLIQGLRHQIRSQLALEGYPIYGDTHYEGTPAERLYLHALHYQLNLEDENISVTDDSAYLFRNFFDLNSLL